LLISNLFERYTAAIQSLPLNTTLTKEQLLVDDFLLRHEESIEMYFAPHNEYLNPRASVLIVGITPGWTQMEVAFRMARLYLEQDLPTKEVCKKVKAAARFAGPMRKNMVEMLNELELHKYLQIEDAEELFGDNHELLHTTSMLRYPVFAAKKNYNGHNPALLSTPLLREFCLQSVTTEIRHLHRPMIIPLGKTVETVMRVLASDGLIDPRQCLWGFPHPSGANGHRHKQFAQAFESMKQTVTKFEWR
jgi:hypothetical protein